MHLVKADAQKFSFQISRLEKRALLDVIALYPLIPATHHRLSRTEERKEDQELLEEALAAHRRAHRKQVQAMLNAKSRFRPNKDGFQFSLKPDQLEWLLQVLNDVRVGSWLALGSPDGPKEILAALNPRTARQFQVMEAAGMIEMILLAAMNAGRDGA